MQTPPSFKLPDVEYELCIEGDQGALWRVHSVRVAEGVNSPLRGVVEASLDEPLDGDALLGGDVELRVLRGVYDPQFVFGIVTQIDHLGYADHRLHLRIHVGSAFEILRQEFDSRIWQNVSVLDILEDRLVPALAEYGRTVDVGKVTRGRSPRVYCVQYRESLHAFVCRLLEEEGISHTLVHDPDKRHEVLRLYDDNAHYPKLSGLSDCDELPLIANNADETDVESVQVFEWTHALTSTAALRRDFDWTQPETPLTAQADGTDRRGRVRRIYTHNARRFCGDDLAQRAKDQQAAAALTGVIYRGRSNATVIRPGATFKLTGHDNVDPAQVFIVLGVRHFGQPEGGSQYANDFECVPFESEIRPAQVTPKPQVRGMHTAIVTGEEEIHTDEYGRIQVQFSWVESPSYGAGSSCWIRCAQSWSGDGWGAQFIPRVGMEVVVEFVEGNPDRPLVTGCVFDGSRGHPFVLPDNKSQSGWRTRSTPNSEGFNELRFEDAAGAEEIFLHAERNLQTVVKAAESRSVGSSRWTSIGCNDSLVVKECISVTAEGGDRVVSICAGSDTLTVHKDMSVTVETGGSSKSVPNGAEKLDAKTITLTGADSITLECGASKIVMTPGKIELNSPLITLN